MLKRFKYANNYILKLATYKIIIISQHRLTVSYVHVYKNSNKYIEDILYECKVLVTVFYQLIAAATINFR